MDQLVQNLKDGAMKILEVPYPALTSNTILVRNHYSVISAGTEGKTVHDARLGYLAKARARKDDVKKVLKTMKTEGIFNTYNMVMNKLESPSSLGYSCAGEVIKVGSDITEFKKGDRVACAGTGAVHAEIVSVAKNLCVKVPANVSLDQAAFSTMGAIALQGIRQANLHLGDNCVIIGLGMVGLLTAHLLNASGIKAMAVDINESQVELAKQSGLDLVYHRQREDLEEILQNHSDNFGTDAVIITAGTNSLDPINFAGSLCRQKGIIVVVGNVPTGFERKNFYKKELDLRMSCSYGPGRHDPNYEEKGQDYPIGYVRWTENRNMQAFVELLARERLNLNGLISHRFEFKNAAEAYKMILEKEETFAGIILQYDTLKEHVADVVLSKNKIEVSDVNIGFIGAGSFAQNILLPALQKRGKFVGVATARPNNARNIADKYGFHYCTGDADKIVQDSDVNTLFIVTRHNTHSEYVLKGLQNNKNIFVEKPLCLKYEELKAINEEYEKRNVHLMVGFNRRFSPQVQKLKSSLLNEQPKAINYRINAGVLPKEHWVNDKMVGGGRILGEVCHFVDLVMHLAGSEVSSVTANSMDSPGGVDNTLVITLAFGNGSVASISYFSNGNNKLSKEHLEVFCNGQVTVIDDFKTMHQYGESSSKSSLSRPNKGYKEELKRFVEAIEKGDPTPIPFQEIYNSTLATIAVLDSIRDKQTVLVGSYAN